MASYNQIQNSFISGEISPLLQERTDLEDFKQSAKRLENFVALPQGGVTRRNGSIHMGNITEICNEIDDENFLSLEPGDLQTTVMIPFKVAGDELLLVLRKQYYLDLGNPVWGISSYVFYPFDRENYFNSLFGSPFDSISSGKGCRTLRCFPQWNGSYTSSYMFRSIDQLGIYVKESLDRIFESKFHHAQSGDFIVITNESGLMPPIYFWKYRKETADYSIYFGTFSPTISGTDIYFNQFLAVTIRAPANQPRVGFVTSGNLYSGRYSTYPSENANITGTTFSPSANTVGSAANVTSSAVFFVGTTADWVGKIIFISIGSTTGAFLITARTSDTVVATICLKSAGATTAVTNWSISMWGGNYGFPRTVCFYNQRLVFGGNLRYVDTLWNSYVGNYFRFLQFKLLDDTGTLDNAYAFSMAPASSAPSDIKWITSSDVIEVGCSSQEFTISGISGLYSPVSFDIKTQTSRGSIDAMPGRTDRITFFASKDGKKLYGFNKVYQTGEYDVLDFGVQGQYLVESEFDNSGELFFDDNSVIKKVVVSRMESIVWILVNKPLIEIDESDNTSLTYKLKSYLLGLTYNETGKVIAWHRHVLKEDGVLGRAIYSESNTPVDVKGVYIEDIAVIENDGYAKLLLLTQRHDVVTGGRYDSLECIRNNTPRNKFFVKFNSPEFGHHVTSYLDNSCFYWDPAAGDITDFTIYNPARQYAGQTVLACCVDEDGVFFQESVVVDNNGGFVLTKGCVAFILGKKLKSVMVTNRVDSGALFGSAQGLIKRSQEAHLRLYKSRGGNFSPYMSLGKDTPIPYPPEATQTLYTGDCRLSLRNSPEEDLIAVYTDDIYSFTLLTLTQEGVLYDP